MEKVILITNTSDIARAVDELHDWWLDVAAIEWNRDRTRVRIPFAEASASLAEGHYEKWLVVDAVQSLEVRDTEKVGFYDLNRVTVEGGLLKLECGIPLEIEMKVLWPGPLKKAPEKEDPEKESGFGVWGRW